MKKENIFKKKDGSKFYLIAFAVLFIALIARIVYVGNVNKPIVSDVATPKAPIELSFSDVLRRANDIKTMDINKDSIATGTLKDGTPYRATITYNPELLEKISKNGAVVSINNRDSMWDGVAKWLPILVSALFLIWLLKILFPSWKVRAVCRKSAFRMTRRVPRSA